MRRLTRIVVLGLLVMMSPRLASADIITFGSVITNGAFSFTGALQNDNDVILMPFAVGVDGTAFDLQTSSFGQNGFDPYLVLLNALTLSVVEFDDPNDPGAVYPAISQDVDGENWDDILSLTLGVGSYLLAVMQFPNEFTGAILVGETLVPTFSRDGELNFTRDLFGQEGSCESFVDSNGTCRTGAFALSGNLTSPTPPPPASVPEPATLTLFGIGAAGAALRSTYRRRNRS